MDSSCTSCNQTHNLGIFEGIRLTLVCTSCASTALSDEGDPIVCFSSARTLFPTIPPKRVKDLMSTPRRNPHYRNAAPMRMYSVAELRGLQGAVDQELRSKALSFQKKRQVRLERLTRVHGISPAAPLHRALFSHIFGDYLWAAHPKRKLKQVKYRFSAHDISVRLCPLDPVAAMNYCENCGITAFVHDQLRRDFEYSLFVSTRAFRLEGLAISRFLCPSQLAELKNGPLSQIQASVERLKKNAPRMLRMALQGQGSCSNTEVERMMKFPAMRTRVRRCIEYAHDPETVAAKMVEFWRTKDDRTHRRRMLQDAMDLRGLDIRPDSVYCHDYICGLIDVDLEELVGIQYITRELLLIPVARVSGASITTRASPRTGRRCSRTATPWTSPLKWRYEGAPRGAGGG
ncbi:unnamed protein product, partial [Ectocarpus sp. 8 AP-2014]